MNAIRWSKIGERVFYWLTNIVIVFYAGMIVLLAIAPDSFTASLGGVSFKPGQEPSWLRASCAFLAVLNGFLVYKMLTHFVALFKSLQTGRFFTETTVTELRSIAKYLFALAMFGAFLSLVIPLILTRTVSISLDIFGFLAAGLVFFLAWIMDVGRLVAEEQELTV